MGKRPTPPGVWQDGARPCLQLSTEPLGSAELLRPRLAAQHRQQSERASAPRCGHHPERLHVRWQQSRWRSGRDVLHADRVRRADRPGPRSLHHGDRRSNGKRPRQQEPRRPAAMQLETDRSESRVIRRYNLAAGWSLRSKARTTGSSRRQRDMTT